MIDLSAAAALLDMGARIDQPRRAEEQLQGAVALHNILERHKVAYLADEVGMGKTYVALAVAALFRHFDPSFRLLVIAPRVNIQRKWMKEMQNFIRFNVRYPDLRVKGLDGRPARPLVACENLLDVIDQAILDPNRDFFSRLTSFSLALGGTRDAVDVGSIRKLRDGLRKYLPWMRDDIFDLRAKKDLKDNFARALNAALPVFDLVIVDEGHNLKHGFKDNVASRNRVLGIAFGRPGTAGDKQRFPRFGPRAKRVLFLSATPVEESYTHLWNQLDVFGLGEPFRLLQDDDADEEAKKEIARQFLVRRVTEIEVNGTRQTRNLYRREWREGGVVEHDKPLEVKDDRQRLVVALVQKKVAELLRHERFGSRFQIGMLASFESFLATAKLKVEEDESTFDDAEQTKDASELEREGIDVADVNRLARSHFEKFRRQLPHPKMDEVVQRLSGAWRTGEKALIFVRRVASVKELKQKLDELYDFWLIGRLERELPAEVRTRFESAVKRYRSDQLSNYHRLGKPGTPIDGEEVDPGGYDTFFEWFFRGEGPQGLISGANIQRRFLQRTSGFSTFFEDNYVAALLRCDPEGVLVRLSEVLGIGSDTLTSELRKRSRAFLSRARKPGRADLYEAAQAAAVEWLAEATSEIQERARVVWHERFEGAKRSPPAEAAPDIGAWLQTATFFTELRKRPELEGRIWPEPGKPTSPRTAFRERQIRGQLLATAARLGHAFIDLYVLMIQRLKSLDAGAKEEEGGAKVDRERIAAYLDLLEGQMRTPLGERGWAAFDELAEISEHFTLVLDVNAPDVIQQPLGEVAVSFGQLLRQQQPVGGMSGQVNQTLVRQFRMPGYPFVLVTTDLLQEGEDLHTFCSSVHHYGISWTPSSMEQRIGRIDRIRSQSDRRLSSLTRSMEGEDKLQVFFPHLQDSVELLQVRNVLRRMNVFLRLMHEGLTTSGHDVRTINAGVEFARDLLPVEQINTVLTTAFGVRPELLKGETTKVEVGPEAAIELAERFQAIPEQRFESLDIAWEPIHPAGMLLGTVHLGKRHQPFALVLESMQGRPLVRGVSPVGRVDIEDDVYELVETAAIHPVRLGAILAAVERSYDLTVEDDVLLGKEASSDALRIGILIGWVTQEADRLEQERLPGRDALLKEFSDELHEEPGRER